MFHIIWKSVLPRAMSLLIILCGMVVTSAWTVGRVLPDPVQMAYMTQHGIHPTTGINWDIFLRDDTRNLDVALTRDPANDRYPAWSPDGSQLAFHSDRAGYWDIYVMDVDGGNLRKLTTHNPAESLVDFPEYDPSETAQPFDPTEQVYSSTGIAMAAWSPDGNAIAFHADFNGAWDLFIVNLEGDLQQRLTKLPMDDVLLSWSPDGKTVAFSSQRNGRMEIYTMDIATSTVRQLTGEADNLPPELLNPTPGVAPSTPYQYTDIGAWHPEWSPDGKQIVFAQSDDTLDEIYVMNADGSDLRRLTENFYEDHNPVWTEDGQHIVFTSDRSEVTQIYMMNVDGSDVRQLTFGRPSDAPAWKP